MSWLDSIFHRAPESTRDKDAKKLNILVGLGNPGSTYDFTRHNIGFRVLDYIGTECNASFKTTTKLQAEIAKVTLADQDVLLVKPTTFMNLSGRAFVAVRQWYKEPLSSFLVVHDDTSLPLGRIRMQKNGGAGGQHGIESIIESLGGSQQFDRLKFGVGPDPGGDRRADYVLKKFPEEQNALLTSSLELATNAVKDWLKNGTQHAMNSFNGIDLAAPPTAPESSKP
jgi:PTH1 family peptidyl-tRNA hydrolase